MVATVGVDQHRRNGLPMPHLLEQITQEVTRAAIDARAGDLLMLHASALVDDATGRAAVFVGPSGMGKTTLSVTLGKQWSYVTDETVAITDDMKVLPYPKPLSIRDGGAAKRQVSAHDCGLVPQQEPCRLGALVLLERRPGLSIATVENVRTIPGIALLAKHTSYLSRLHRPLHHMAHAVHAAGGVRRVSYSEAAQLAPVVTELLAVP